MAPSDPSGPRRIEVPAVRAERWVAGFAGRHGAVRRTAAAAEVLLTAADGAVARLEPLLANDATDLAAWASHPRWVLVVLVRRGGYAIGLADGDRYVAHKVGTRHVQSRTAAGGWSQQRFARRRANQADALVGAVADHTLAVLAAAPPGARPAAVVVGGDRRLVADLLGDARLAGLAALPRRELFDLPDPRRAVLDEALRRGRCLRVTLHETPAEEAAMTALDLLPTAAARFGEAVHAVPDDRWDAPSPCDRWTVRDVLNHLVNEHQWAPYLLRGGTIEEAGDRFDGDLLGEDPVAAWDAAAAESMAAWAEVGEDSPVALSFGTVPASVYAQQMLADLVIHAWDLARGAGVDDRLEPQTARTVLGYAEAHADELAGSGLFAPPVAVSGDDPQDRLLALSGRDPDWSAA